jgi:hypothetical protein
MIIISLGNAKRKGSNTLQRPEISAPDKYTQSIVNEKEGKMSFKSISLIHPKQGFQDALSRAF